MEVKEAIEKIISVFDDWVDEYSCRASETTEKEEEKEGIIALLQQGEKYRQIVDELKNKPTILTHGMLPHWLKELEQKYFPKEERE